VNYPNASKLSVLMRDGRAADEEDMVAEEVPIALEYNGISHVVMFATPADLLDFARGFTLSEGIVEDPDQIYGIDEEPDARGIRVALEIASAPFALLKERRRALTGRTGCGLCGSESLEHAVRPLAPLAGSFNIDASLLTHAMQQLKQRQALMQATGAVHAAGWVDDSGALLLVREDVGRHNALDKLIGAMSAARLDFSKGAALITSRASFEMVQKAVTLGMPVLAAVSAPTALAVRMARSTKLGLLGFVRDGHSACYSEPGRFNNALNDCIVAGSLESAV
jgi:FdhD protein